MSQTSVAFSLAAFAAAASAGLARLRWRSLFGAFKRPKPEPVLAAPTVLETDWLLVDSEQEPAFERWLNGGPMPDLFNSATQPCLGCHILVELYGCAPGTLEKEPYVAIAMQDAANRSEATTVASAFHAFNPCGVSGAVIIQESHYTIHTWPEHGYAAVDFFFCGDTVKVHKAVEVLRERFKPERMKFLVIGRGLRREVG